MIPTDGTRSQHGPTRRMRPSGDGSTSYPGARSADVSNFSSSRTILPETKGMSLEELGADNERSAATCLAPASLAHSLASDHGDTVVLLQHE